MAGGIWLSQNKVRPGAYLNFVSVPKSLMTVGDRGIAIIPLTLSWGPSDRLIEVLSTDMLTGESLSSVGFTAFDTDAQTVMLNLMLQNCYKALVFRTNANGVQARVTMGNLTVKAIYAGVFGNEIQIAIVDNGDETFDVKTYVRTRLSDTQTVATVQELVDNNYVLFSGFGELEEYAGEPLSGGTDGTAIAPSAWLPDFLDLASVAKWQTMAMPIEDPIISKNILTFITDQREGQGRYVQAVVPNYAADYEGIINNVNGATIDTVDVSVVEFTAWVAGATAGATIVESNTNRTIIGATDIEGEMTNEGIIQALQRGELVLSRNQTNAVRVEQDINSFITFTQGKGKERRKNRIIRTLDEIGMTVRSTWETSYMGHINNDENGRANFKKDVIEYIYELQRIGAIQEFGGSEDVIVSQGVDLDVVVCELTIKPVDSMEFLYMTVNVRTA